MPSGIDSGVTARIVDDEVSLRPVSRSKGGIGSGELTSRRLRRCLKGSMADKGAHRVWPLVGGYKRQCAYRVVRALFLCVPWDKKAVVVSITTSVGATSALAGGTRPSVGQRKERAEGSDGGRRSIRSCRIVCMYVASLAVAGRRASGRAVWALSETPRYGPVHRGRAGRATGEAWDGTRRPQQRETE
jgi:hypothetical protein